MVGGGVGTLAVWHQDLYNSRSFFLGEVVTSQILQGHTNISAICKNCFDKLPIKRRVSHGMLHPSDIIISEDHSYFITGHTQFEKAYLSVVSQDNLCCVHVCVCMCVCMCERVCMCVYVCVCVGGGDWIKVCCIQDVTTPNREYFIRWKRADGG